MFSYTIDWEGAAAGVKYIFLESGIKVEASQTD